MSTHVSWSNQLEDLIHSGGLGRVFLPSRRANVNTTHGPGIWAKMLRDKQLQRLREGLQFWGVRSKRDRCFVPEVLFESAKGLEQEVIDTLTADAGRVTWVPRPATVLPNEDRLT
jgi:hypothetical protein